MEINQEKDNETIVQKEKYLSDIKKYQEKLKDR